MLLVKANVVGCRESSVNSRNLIELMNGYDLAREDSYPYLVRDIPMKAAITVSFIIIRASRKKRIL